MKMFALSLFILSAVCSSFASIPLSENDKDDMIFVLGKWFYKSGQPPQANITTEPQRFQQCMDHFKSGGCNTKWNQRYWVKQDYYKPGGPIFFLFGGEGPADRYIDSFNWQNYGRHYNAMLIVLEHRFYGYSYPSRENKIEVLKLLTSQQALADAAYFIKQFKRMKKLRANHWVVFGGSYAGNLAAWMKQKYPKLVKAAVSSSGPLVAQYDFPGFLETVSEVVKATDSKCYKKVYNAFKCMETLVHGGKCRSYNSTSQIVPALQQCHRVDFGNLLSRESFFFTISMSKWGDNWPSHRVINNCRILRDSNSVDPLKTYGNFLAKTGGHCKTDQEETDNLEEAFKFIRSKEGLRAGAAGWFWQTCYEFGYYMSADPKHGLFGRKTFSGWPLGSQCRRLFGSRFTKRYTQSRIRRTNRYYKGRNIDSKCVIFVNGGWDPWHTLGINKASETSRRNTVVHTSRGEHCDDMKYARNAEMRRAQAKIQRQIGVYLKDSRC